MRAGASQLHWYGEVYRAYTVVGCGQAPVSYTNLAREALIDVVVGCGQAPVSYTILRTLVMCILVVGCGQAPVSYT